MTRTKKNSSLFLPVLGLLFAIPAMVAMLFFYRQAQGLRAGLAAASPVAATVIDKQSETRQSGKNKHTYYYFELQTDGTKGKKFRVQTGSKLYYSLSIGAKTIITSDPLGKYDWIIIDDPWQLKRPAKNFHKSFFILSFGIIAVICGFMRPKTSAFWTLKPKQPTFGLWAVATCGLLPGIILFLAPNMRIGFPDSQVVAMAGQLILTGLAAVCFGFAWNWGPRIVDSPVAAAAEENDNPPARTPLTNVAPPVIGRAADPDSPFHPISFQRFYGTLLLAMTTGWAAFGIATLDLGDSLAGALLAASGLAFWRVSSGVADMREALARAWNVVEEVKPSSAAGVAGTWRGLFFERKSASLLTVQLENSHDFRVVGSILDETPLLPEQRDQQKQLPGKIEGGYNPEIGELTFARDSMSFSALPIKEDAWEGSWTQHKRSGKFILRREAASSASGS
jgi:hypothetical protein